MSFFKTNILLRAGPFILLFWFILVNSAYGSTSSWEYFITNSDQDMIDMEQTTAEIDNTKNEITLKKILPTSVGLYEEEVDYIVLSSDGFKHYSFNGIQMQEVEFLGISLKNSNPLSACASSPYPDAVLYNEDEKKIIHYSFSGTAMVENPTLSIVGVENIINIGTRDLDLAFIRDNRFEYWGFTGENLINIPELSSELTNPIDFALFPDSYNMVVIDGKIIKYFKNGSKVLELTGFTNPVSISANKTAIAVVDGNEIKHYNISEDSFTYSSALSITTDNPRCVALRPGTQDRVVIEGNEVKYYSFDGSGLLYNPALSTTIDGLDKIFIYIPSAIVVSKTPEVLNKDVSQARVRAYCEVPEGTSILWYLTVDDKEWTTCWRVRGTESGSILEINKDAAWHSIGNVYDAYPDNENKDLVFEFNPAGKNIKWKAELKGNSKTTPKIKAIGSKCAIKLDINAKPDIPIIVPPDPEGTNYCLSTATPTLEWIFKDPDDDDAQSGFRIQVETIKEESVFAESEVEILFEDYGELATKQEYTISEETLFDSGEYRFRYRVKTRDKGELWSEKYSEWQEFCVVAFDSPKIREIVHPSLNQSVSMIEKIKALDPEKPETYINIAKNMPAEELPRTKAGGKVGLLLNGIGLKVDSIKDGIKIYYKNAHDNVDNDVVIVNEYPSVVKEVGTNNKFLFEFYTSPDSLICPNGTIVQGEFEGVSYNTHSIMILCPDPYLNDYHADGIILVDGTVLSDWMVVLQGRKNS